MATSQSRKARTLLVASQRPRLIKVGLFAILLASVSACADLVPSIQNRSLLEQPDPLPVTQPPLPKASGFSDAVMAPLACINQSRVLRGKRFAIAVHADGTGKSAVGYEGGTGSFLPQGTSAIWAAQAVMFAGGTAQNYYELNTERAIRQFAGEMEAQRLSENLEAQSPQFVVSTAFTALDFLGGESMDIRVSGIGPRSDLRGASIEVSAEIYRPGDRTTLAISSMSRQVIYRSAGIGVGTIVGSGSGVLVTGDVSYTDQQRLQEASRDVIGIAVADVLSRVPGVPAKCKAGYVAEQPTPASVQTTPPAAAVAADPKPVVPASAGPLRIMVGAYSQESGAQRTLLRLREAGLDPTVTTRQKDGRQLWLVHAPEMVGNLSLGKIRNLGFPDAYYLEM